MNIQLDFAATDFVDVQYSNNLDCACARAAKRHFNTDDVRVSGYAIKVNDTEHAIVATYLNGESIDVNPGFGIMSMQRMKAAFDKDPNTKAHVTLQSF